MGGGGALGVMERRRGKKERCGGGVTAGRRGGTSETGLPRVTLHLSIRFLVGREEERVK